MKTAMNLLWRALLCTAVLTPLLGQQPGQRPFNATEQRQPPHGPGEPGRAPFAPGGEPMRVTPQTLPELDKLAVSPADKDGFVTVSGAAGAVPGGAVVFVLSLQTGARVQTTADVAGKFSARIAAPDGSALVINHAGERARDWREGGLHRLIPDL